MFFLICEKIYSGGVPIFKEGDIFISKIPILQVTPQVELHIKYEKIILDDCINARTSNEIQEYIGIKDKRYFMKSILNPLVKKDYVLLTIPDNPRSSKQKYIVKK